MNITETAEFLKSGDNFTIICHVNPDGDTLGSAFALCGALQLAGKRARVLCADVISPRFNYLYDAVKAQEFPDGSAETVIAVDVADAALFGDYEKKYGGTVDLCIDHHVSNKFYALRTLLDENASATAEIVWELIKETGVSPSAEIAAAIYTGISTDTGCYRYSNTTAKAHVITAELMKYGFDISGINYVMFDMKTRERVALEKEALNRIEYHFGGRCAVITLTREITGNIDPEDMNGVSSLPRQIEGVDAGVVIKEKGDNLWKASLRTSGKVDAQAICCRLGGGGHLQAAGCTLGGDLDTVRAILLKEIEKQLAP
ncbi:MAG: bifunctional oligoribonuclease/PAP phosphatase NrnA [Oscillospiraceae bacterium]|jgi:phosphoesterase RecJ-like protein|nr:bifunctional oligoribonuclease/PAP phosphatase NrnA [Oscillospiraceae bacterium]